MLTLEQTPNQALAFEFSEFVKAHQRPNPPNREALRQETPAPAIDEINDRTVTQHWDQFGQHFSSIETAETFGITMLVLLDHLKPPKGEERWLSVGTGPGYYETFLARLFPQVTIESIDQSETMLREQETMLATQPTDITRRVHPRLGSICTLNDADGLYDRVLAINCLHWVPDWRKGATNLSRMLSAKAGSPIYLVTTNATIYDRSRTRSITPDLNKNLLDQLRKLKLHPTHTGRLAAERGQWNQPAIRLYTVGKRANGKILYQPPKDVPYEIYTRITDDVHVTKIADRKNKI